MGYPQLKERAPSGSRILPFAYESSSKTSEGQWQRAVGRNNRAVAIIILGVGFTTVAPTSIEKEALGVDAYFIGETPTSVLNAGLPNDVGYFAASEEKGAASAEHWLDDLQKIQNILGLNTTQLAAVIGVTRMAIYKWRASDSSVDPEPSNLNRIEYLSAMLSSQKLPGLNLYGKFGRRVVSTDNSTVIDLMAKAEFSEDDLQSIYAKLEPSIRKWIDRSAVGDMEATNQGGIPEGNAALEKYTGITG